MGCTVPTCTYDTEEDIEKTSALGNHLTLFGFHRDDVHPKPPKQPAATGHPAPAPART